MSNHLNKIDVLPFMSHWCSDGDLSFTTGPRGSNLVSAGFTSLNLPQKTELSKVAIPAVIKGTEQYLSNMVIFSELLQSLDVVPHVNNPESSEPASSPNDGDDDLDRYELFAGSLDPRNILEGFCGTICQIPRDTLPFHVDSGDCKLRDHNYTAVFSLLVAHPNKQADGCAEKFTSPYRILRIATLGYTRKACHDFVLRLNRRHQLLHKIIESQQHMAVQQHSNSAKTFIESAVPVAVIGERKLMIKIKDETEIEKC